MEALRATAIEAGRVYRSNGAINAELLRPHVFRSWERSHLGGAEPRRPRAEGLSSIETERLQERHGRLIEAARPYMRALSVASGRERHAAMLGDPRAIVLDVVGDEQSMGGPERVPGPGALLEEGACGANGIGTPLVEGGYVELVGPEHFIEGFYPFTCQGIPLYDGTGALAGVLSVSVRSPNVGHRLRQIVFCSAHAIEMQLLAARLEEELCRALSLQGSGVEHLERLLGDILQGQQTVSLRVAMAADRFARQELTHARGLIELAAAALGRFQRQAALWRALALEAAAAPCALALDVALFEMVELLEVEATIGRAEVVLHEVEAVVVEADPNVLARTLFRGLFSAIRAARGGVVHIDLRRTRGGGELCLRAIPGAKVADEAPGTQRLTIPRHPGADRPRSSLRGVPGHE